MKASEIMNTQVVTCQTSDTASQAVQLMWEHRCGCLPVLDSLGKVVGLVSDRDACMAAYAQGLPLTSIPITTAMPRTLATCGLSADLDEVLEVMMTNGVHRILIVDGERRLQGLIALTDIARAGGDWDVNNAMEIDLAKVAQTLGKAARRRRPENTGSEGESSNLTDVVRHSLEALKTLRDEIRVDLNLASKELRDRWHHLEDEIRRAERSARHELAGGTHSLNPVFENLKKFRNTIRKQASASAL